MFLNRQSWRILQNFFRAPSLSHCTTILSQRPNTGIFNCGLNNNFQLIIVCVISHAFVRCEDEKQALKVLEMRDLKMLGKKVYASIGFYSMMKNKPLV